MTTQHEMEIAHAQQRSSPLCTKLQTTIWPFSRTLHDRSATATLWVRLAIFMPNASVYWCRRAMIRGWWAGFRYWSEAATAASSLAIISIPSPAGFPDAVRRLRRGLRDVRDRTARHWKRWRTVSFAGLMGGDRTALLLISHDGVDRREVQDVLSRRWPDVVVKELEQEEPTWR